MRGHGLSGYEGLHSDMVAERPLMRVVSVLAGVHWDTMGTLDGVTLAAAFPPGLVGLGACSFPGSSNAR